MTLDPRLSTALADRYRIEREVGQGGMATVYLAQDLRHDRRVAVKVLRPELAAVIGAERFVAEIRVTANLQHPHILPLHDSGVAETFLFYVMPFVEGESLRDRLNREKQLPVADAMRIAKEVASALDYAHRHGVIHRDIKPENILLHDGQALVADFGIALAVTAAGGSRMTETGMSLGTPQYMSPEQAMGERVLDARTDIYALGCVTYEMLLGEPPFTGPTTQSIVAKVMTEKPAPLVSRRETIPDQVEEAVLTALAKLPADRWGSAAEFAGALEGRGSTTRLPVSGSRRAAKAPSRRALVLPVLAAVSILLALWGWLRSPSASPAPVLRFVVGLPASEQLYEAPIPLMAAAPDGSGFVYVGVGPMGRRLIWHDFAQFTSRPLLGTEDAERPFISADGEWVGYFANGKMWKVPIAGGQPSEITAQAVGGAAWSSKGIIVFGDGKTHGLSTVPADGGEPVPLTKVDSATGEIDHITPRLLPGEQQVVFTIRTRSTARFAVASLATGAVTILGEGRLPTSASPGHLAFLTADGPRLVAFDSHRLKLIGLPTPIAVDPSSSEPVSEFDISRTGTLIYLTRDLSHRTLVEVDRAGRERVVSPEPGGYDSPRYSPDGRRIAARIQDDGFNIWVFELARGTSLRLTFDQNSFYPEWTPDGSRIVFPRTAGGQTGLFWKLANGAGEAEPFYDPPEAQWESSWSRDGRRVVIRMNDSLTGRDLWLLTMPERRAAPLLATRASETAPKISPDGRFLAYVSNVTGRAEVYVRTLPDSGGTWLASDGGGTEPLWSPDGHQLYYRSGDAIMAVGVETRPSFSLGRRDSLFTGSFVPNPTHTNYDVDPSGNRFIMVRMAEGERRAVVILNWAAELGRQSATP